MSEAETFRVALALEVERDELRTAIAASQAHAKALREAATEVMAALEQHGAAIVPHLIDTDDNAGQRLREALALPADTSALDAELAKERGRERDRAINLMRALMDRCALYPEADVQHIIDDLIAESFGPAPADGGRETR